MEVVDAKKLETAILYLQRITEGKNPVNNMPAEEGDIINNPNVVRCMFFVKEVLEELKRNDGYIGRRPRTNRDDSKKEYPLEALEAFRYTGDKPISKLVGQFNEYADMTVYQKLVYNPVKQWLLENGYLVEEQKAGSEKRITRPTDKGTEAGIKSEMRTSPRGGSYLYITYGQKAQEMIVENRYKFFKQDNVSSSSGGEELRS